MIVKRAYTLLIVVNSITVTKVYVATFEFTFSDSGVGSRHRATLVHLAAYRAAAQNGRRKTRNVTRPRDRRRADPKRRNSANPRSRRYTRDTFQRLETPNGTRGANSLSFRTENCGNRDSFRTIIFLWRKRKSGNRGAQGFGGGKVLFGVKRSSFESGGKFDGNRVATIGAIDVINEAAV